MALIFLLLSASAALAASLEVRVTELGEGPIIAALFSEPEGFPDEGKPFREARSEGATIRFPDLPPGKYAVSLFQDTNKNGKLDRDSIGVPSEPFGFSENPRIFFGAPGFKRCDFDFAKEDLSIEVKLKRF